MTSRTETFDGGCACGEVRYRLTARPMFVHCCHCRWCQRESGAAFALNAMIEADRVVLLRGAPDLVPTPSESGRGQKFRRCPTCRIALWSNYAGSGDAVRFVRVARSTSPTACHPTSISSPSPSSPGSCCRRGRRLCRNSTTARRCGRRRAWTGAQRSTSSRAV
ncbi:MAG: GFA family protein [Reyranella sp.]|nr:GFA family protein [Reyranella sp.]